ncbi:MAG TPA: nucleoside hydrolase [Longimicrobiales bacterium]
MAKEPIRHVVLDTDIGDDIDDAYALALALRSPRAELAAVVTSGGCAAERARTARRLIRLAGRDVPVFAGVDAGAAGALNYAAAAGGDPHDERVPAFAAAVAAVRAALHDGPVTLVCIGGLSNAARLLDALDADERRRLEIVAMGGSFERDYTGAAGAAREGNIARDIPAARRVLASDAPVTLVPVDATWHLTLDEERRRLAHDPATGLGPALADLYAQWLDAYGYPGPVLHDPFALAVALDAPLARFDSFPVELDDAGYTRRARSGAPRRVALAGDRDAFMQWVEQTLQTAGADVRSRAGPACPSTT